MEVLPEFKLHRPADLAEALKIRGSLDEARYVSGGTDLLANIRRGLTPTENLIELSGVSELQRMERDDEGLHIGAAVTLAAIAGDADIARHYAVLSEAAAVVAGPTHREVATLGGNLCLDTRCLFYNQSQWWRDSNDGCMKYEGEICHVVPTSKRCYAAYSGDTAPALLVLNAEIDIAGPEGSRRIPLDELFNDDGIDYLTLKPGEMVTMIHIPASSSSAEQGTSSYTKLRIRDSIDFPLAGIAVRVATEGGKVTALQAALTGTNSTPVRIAGCDQFIGEAFDEEQARKLAKQVQKQASPVATTTIQPQYRRRALMAMSKTLVTKLLDGLSA
jgi:4-hydroxybenzoyl-CoA reductase subunit beta